MKKGLTELVFILDKSGSMGGLEADTIGGYNAMIEHQRREDGSCLMTTVLFDQSDTLLHDRIDIRAVRLISDREYCVGGSTALLDAIGKTIHKMVNAQKHTTEDWQPEKVLFVIITDGEENSSREYTLTQVRQMIEQMKRTGWEFIFLGANIDAVETAGRFGIQAERAQDFHADSAGVSLNFQAMSETVSRYRQNDRLPDDWKQAIDQDFRGRGKKKDQSGQ